MNDSVHTHALNPRIQSMKCLKCGKTYPVDDYFYGCPSCLAEGENASMTFVYASPRSIEPQERGMQRFRQFLPYPDTVTLGEGDTPVLELPALARELGVAAVYTKNEFQNPTGSHKDRMNPFITARALQAGYDTVTCASSGNEAASLAAYAAADEIACVNVSTRSIPSFWENASEAANAQLVLTETPALRLAWQREKIENEKGWYCATNLLDIPTSSSPFGIQGYKTISYELFLEFGDCLPEYIFIPTCRGDLLYGICEGFLDLLTEGYISALPHLAACEPFPRLELILEEGHDHKEKFEGDSSSTSSIGGNTATWQSVYALKKSQGFAVSAADFDVSEAVKALGRHGLFLETSSAVVYPCLQRALRQGKIKKDSSILLVLTSSGYKNVLSL